MSRRRRAGGWIGALIGFGILSLILYPPKNQPRKYSGVILNRQADAILRRSCFDCHSNEVRYPWYSYLPVVSFAVGRHVAEGRKDLNFSDWETMEERQRNSGLSESYDDIAKGEMPPWSYTLIHKEAKLSPQDILVFQHALEAPAQKGHAD